MELISGLPEDVARDCLIRVSYQQFAAVASVSKGWKREIEMPEFRRLRKSTGHTQKILVTVHSRVDPEKCGESILKKALTNPVYQLSVFEPETGIWKELPPVPGLAGGLPMFCQIAGAGFDLVVIGGLDPDSWKASNSVFIYNFISAKWRRGSDMLGGPRTFFACGSDSDHTVYVAGGHDEEKNALRSALAYDVARDVWFPLPDMARERDECKAVFHRGTLRVVGGYCTEMQGHFERSAEAFEVATWMWAPVDEDFLDSATCPRTFVDTGDEEERMYMCRGGDVVLLTGSKWQTVAKLPVEIRNVAYVGALDGALLLIGSSGYSIPHMGFVLDLKTHSWRKLLSPESNTGHIQSGCHLEI